MYLCLCYNFIFVLSQDFCAALASGYYIQHNNYAVHQHSLLFWFLFDVMFLLYLGSIFAWRKQFRKRGIFEKPGIKGAIKNTSEYSE